MKTRPNTLRFIFKATPAFTLIELLVVISIISLLISILLPALGSARQSAMGLQCVSYQKSIGTIFHIYASDNRDYAPYSYDYGYVWYMNSKAWLAQYGGSDSLKMDCPSYKLLYKTGFGNYAFSSHVAAAPSWGRPYNRISDYLKPTKTLVLVDVQYEGSNENSTWQFSTSDQLSPIGGSFATNFDYRHLGAANMLYVDGHAAANKVQIAYTSEAWNK